MNKVNTPLKKNSIILARISDSLGKPAIESIIDYPDFHATIKDSAVLRGIDIAELRVLDIDNKTKQLRVCLHASSVLNPQVSTGRAIFITYFSMRNTAIHIIRNVFF